MGYIFISYSHKDKDYVHRLHEALEQEGFDVWIDDRIDYGHEWPKVIQGKLDDCEVFIVVMSGNSYDSDMVQNEVTRAREKKKPIFTLLLDGDNWLIFQAKQYVDIRDGKLPPEKFYLNLEKHINRQEVYDPLRFIHSTEEWTPYQNKEYGFSMRYPLDAEKVIDEPERVRINFPVVPGTNLRDKYITVDVAKGEPCASPRTKDWYDETATMVARKKVRIGNLIFLREIGDDAGMSKYHQWVCYSSFRNNTCVSISIYTTVVSDGPYYPHELPKIDVDADKEIILKTVSTFHWLDDDNSSSVG